MGLNAVAPSPTLTVGGQVFTDLDNLTILTSGSGSASNTNGTFRLPNGTSGYQVPVGKKLVVKASKIVGRAAASSPWTLLYSDNDMGIGTTTVPTNPVYFGGSANVALNTSTSVGSIQEIGGFDFEVPASKYVGIIDGDLTASISCFLYCYLIDA